MRLAQMVYVCGLEVRKLVLKELSAIFRRIY